MSSPVDSNLPSQLLPLRLTPPRFLHHILHRLVAANLHHFPVHVRPTVARRVSAELAPDPAQTAVLDHRLEVRHAAALHLMQRQADRQVLSSRRGSVHAADARLVGSYVVLIVDRPGPRDVRIIVLLLLRILFLIGPRQQMQLLQRIPALAQQRAQRDVEHVGAAVQLLVPRREVRAAVSAELPAGRGLCGQCARRVEGAFDGVVGFVGELGDGGAAVPVERDAEPGGEGRCLDSSCGTVSAGVKQVVSFGVMYGSRRRCRRRPGPVARHWRG